MPAPREDMSNAVAHSPCADHSYTIDVHRNLVRMLLSDQFPRV
jgi:hypothetical protein